jgi:transposase
MTRLPRDLPESRLKGATPTSAPISRRPVSPSSRSSATLAGVAPYDDQSGRRDGRRSIRGGRAALRCVLYMATLSAMRCNPVIRAFADRLRAAGKLSKVVITACMRKLLALINAMVRDGLTRHQLDVVKKLAANP